MSQSTSTSLFQRLLHPFRYAWIQLRRCVFHFFLRYRLASSVKRSTIVDLDESRTDRAELVSSAKFPIWDPERKSHVDHDRAVVDEPGSHSARTYAVVAAARQQDGPQQAQFSSRSDSRQNAEMAAGAFVARPAEEDQTGLMTEWFGPGSDRQKLWIFTTATAIAGMIIAIILLFQGHTPTEDPPVAQLLVKSAPDPFEEKKQPEPKPEPKPEPREAPPFEAVVSRPVPKPEFTPEPEPEPEVVVVPEPVDQVSVEVILLPAPDEGTGGEQFEVTDSDRPANLNIGFAPEILADWQRGGTVDTAQVDPWLNLEKLIPLGPFEPADHAQSAIEDKSLAPSYLTTQPRMATQSLLLPYEMIVTNRGTTAIDRLVLEQTLPESLKLRSTSAVHAADGKTLRWEFERLANDESWRIPMVLIPTQQGQVRPQTKLEAGVSVSSRTIIQAPGIQMEILAGQTAPLNKYHQLVFKLTNTGELPLNDIRMAIRLSENLWHRFGQQFVFTETSLAVGETREALLHVKTKETGPAQLVAKLTTDEHAEATGQVAFHVAQSDRPATASSTNDQPVKEQPTPRKETAPTPTPAEPTPVDPKPTPATEAPLFGGETKPTPAAETESDAPLFSPPAEKPVENKPIRNDFPEPPPRKPLIPADSGSPFEAPEPAKKPAPADPVVPEKKTPAPVEPNADNAFPDFPGSIDPFDPPAKKDAPEAPAVKKEVPPLENNRSPIVPERKEVPPLERKPVEADPFEIPKEKGDNFFGDD